MYWTLFVQQDFKLLHLLNMSHDTLTVTFYRGYIKDIVPTTIEREISDWRHALNHAEHIDNIPLSSSVRVGAVIN